MVFLIPLLLLVVVVAGFAVVGTTRGLRGSLQNYQTRSPATLEYRRLRRRRRLRFAGLVAVVAAVGFVWAWALRDPIIDPDAILPVGF